MRKTHVHVWKPCKVDNRRTAVVMVVVLVRSICFTLTMLPVVIQTNRAVAQVAERHCLARSCSCRRSSSSGTGGIQCIARNVDCSVPRHHCWLIAHRFAWCYVHCTNASIHYLSVLKARDHLRLHCLSARKARDHLRVLAITRYIK